MNAAVEQRINSSLKNFFSIRFAEVQSEQEPNDFFCKEKGLKVLYVISGNLNLVIENEKVRARAGDIFIANQLGSIQKLNGLQMFSAKVCMIEIDYMHEGVWPAWIILQESFKALLQQALLNGRVVQLREDSEIRSSYRKIHQMLRIKNGAKINQNLIKIYINLVLVECLKYMSNDAEQLEPVSRKEEEVKEFLKSLENVSSCEWDLNLMAKKCGLGRSAFSEYCKKITNKTPLTYLRHLRIKRACKMLQNSLEMNVKKISSLCGYHSNQYFTREFRRVTGVTPTEYREKYL